MAQKIRIRIKAYDHRVLDQAAWKIVDTATRTGALVAGPVPLPTSIAKYTVVRGPFVDKDSREQYEMRVHKRIVDVLDPNPKVIEALMRLSAEAAATSERLEEQEIHGEPDLASTESGFLFGFVFGWFV